MECLGVDPVAVRRYIILKLDELRAMNVKLCNYPCSIESPLSSNFNSFNFNCEEKNNLNCCPCSPTSLKSIEWQQKYEEPIECSILLHVGMYSRTLETKTNIGGNKNNNTTISPIYRFKVYFLLF